MIAADVAATFNVADFAVTAKVNGGREVKVIFDRDASSVLGVDTHSSAITCAVSDQVQAGDFLTIGTNIYKCVARLTGDNDVESWQVQTA